MKKLFLLLAAATLFSCSSSSDDAPVIPTTPTAIAYIKGNFGGTPLDYTMTSYLVSNYYMGFESGFQGDGFTRSYYYGCSMRPAGSAGTEKYVSIDFENMYISNDESSEDAAFYGAFTPVPTNYITSVQNDLRTKGISVTYQTPTAYYATLSGSQSGSNMTIASAVEGIEPGGSAKIITITGTFNCKLYNDSDSSDVINVTGGQFKIMVKEYE